jgi:putative peptidoglycan lipid II flippase
MIAYVARDTLTRVFYSLGDSRLPLLVAVFSIILKIILNTILVKKYHASGIAFATSIVTVFNFLFLWLLLRGKIGSLGWGKQIRSLIKLIIVTFIMYLFGILFLNVFPLHMEKYDFMSKIILIFSSFVVCFLVYFGLALTIRLEEAEQVAKEIKRRFLKS